MRNILTILFVLLLTSCASFQISTLNHDPMYTSKGQVIDVNAIDTEFQLARKFRTDDRFRWDFAQFAMNQDLRWNYDFYFNNRMYRSPYTSPFDFYWNSHNYWWNWASNYQFNYGFNHWNHFGFYGQGMGWSYSWGNNSWSSNSWNNPYGWRNGYGWNNGDRRGNVSYNVGRRGSSNISNNRIIRTDNSNIVIRGEVPRIDKELIKLKRNNTNIRIYTNPNNVPPVIIRNNNSRPIRVYNRIENNSNNNINRNNNNSRPIRTYTPPPRSSSPPVINRGSSRSSNPPVISRSSGTRGSVKN